MAYLRAVVKDICLLIAGLACVALSWPLLAYGHIQVGGRYHSFGSLGAMVLFLGLTLIVVAVADWRYRRRKAMGLED